MVQGSLVARYTKAGLAPHVAILQEYRDDAKVGEGGEGPWEGIRLYPGVQECARIYSDPGYFYRQWEQDLRDEVRPRPLPRCPGGQGEGREGQEQGEAEEEGAAGQDDLPIHKDQDGEGEAGGERHKAGEGHRTHPARAEGKEENPEPDQQCSPGVFRPPVKATRQL